MLWVLKHPKIEERIDRNIGTVILVVPSFLFLAFFMGLSEGQASLTTSNLRHTVKIKDLPEAEIVFPLRVLDRGMIVLTADGKRIEFFPWSKVEKFGSEVAVDTRGLACRYFNKAC